MGRKAREARRQTVREFREGRLSEAERQALRQRAVYEGSAHHKRDPHNFGLTPPCAPRPDKTLCDEAGVFDRTAGHELFREAVEGGLVSKATDAQGELPKQIWVVDERGQVFEAMYGGSVAGRYHGYPIRRSDPLFDEVVEAWSERGCGSTS